MNSDAPADQTLQPQDRSAIGHVLWLCAAAAVGFLVPFVAVLHFGVPRNWYVLFHLVASGGLCLAYVLWSRTGAAELIGTPHRGFRGALAAGAMMIAFVVSGPSSSAPSGFELVWSLLWLGVVYAVVDAWLLSVMPVLVVWRIAAVGARLTRVTFAAALGASLLITAAYHLGFPEFQGPRLLMALIGNGILSVAYLGTRSAIAPVLGHVFLHATAVVYGYSSALPVPPHY